MPYKATERTRAKQAATRQRILDAALQLVSEGGYAAVLVSAVALHAGIGTGTVYRYFPSKGELFAEVFRQICDREVAVMRAGAASGQTYRERILTVLRVFSLRAVQSGRVAQALISEPVDPVVDLERLRFRDTYTAILAELIRGAQSTGESTVSDADVVASFLVGGVAQALTSAATNISEEHLVEAITCTVESAVFGGQK